MKIAITGASDLVGRALGARLRADGHEVVELVRREPHAGQVRWDVGSGLLDPRDLEGIDALVHLAGENIAGGRWTEERKRRIRESRTRGTALVASALTQLKSRPVLVSASAVGYYGDRGDEVLVEGARAGEDFLAQVCLAWEAAADPARDAGLRVVHPRFGVVLAKDGGAIAKMKAPFSMGAGGPPRDGPQFLRWIHLDDAAEAIRFALVTSTLRGPCNAVAPVATRNADFTRALGRAMSRPAVIPTPKFALRALFGEMADATLLASQNCVPRVLEQAGFSWKFPALDDALDDLLA